MQFDSIIVGGGSAGAAFALASRGLSQALVAPEPPRDCDAASGLDSRVYAISPGNAAFLRSLGAWGAIPTKRVCAVRGMRVFGDDGRALLEFDAHRHGVSELAWILEDQFLQHALWTGLKRAAGVRLLAPGSCKHVEWLGDRALVHLESGDSLETRLVVGADGARSRVRELAGITVRAKAYGQTAVVANFACARPHRGIAYQWFREGAVLALLPLSGSRVSMVWSASEALAEQVLALSGDALCDELERVSAGALGGFDALTPPIGFPLQRLASDTMVGARVALIGDAAHVVHPLAGQGANLGLQDALALATTLGAREPGRDPGELALLRRYARMRAEPVLAMQTAVHGLYQLFGAPGETLSRLRNLGLRAVDRATPLKNMLMRQALQIGDGGAPMEESG